MLIKELKTVFIFICLACMSGSLFAGFADNSDKNEFSDLLPEYKAVNPEDNAFTYFNKAAEKCFLDDDGDILISDFNEGLPINPVEIKRLINKGDEFSKYIDEGLDCSFCQLPKADDYSIELSYLSKWRKIARYLSFKTRYMSLKGDYDSAGKICIRLLKFGDMIQKNPNAIITYFMGMVFVSQGIAQAKDIINDSGTPLKNLKKLAECLRNIGPYQSGFILAFKCSFALDLNTIKQLEDGKFGDLFPSIKDRFKINKLSVTEKNTLFQPEKTKEIFASFYRSVLENSSIFYNEVKLPDVEKELDLAPGASNRKNIIGRTVCEMLLPGLDSTLKRKCTMASTLEGIRLQCALKLYEREKGKLPENLEELMPEYIKKLPVSSFDGRQFSYDRAEREVSCIGADKKDKIIFSLKEIPESRKLFSKTDLDKVKGFLRSTDLMQALKNKAEFQTEYFSRIFPAIKGGYTKKLYDSIFNSNLNSYTETASYMFTPDEINAQVKFWDSDIGVKLKNALTELQDEYLKISRWTLFNKDRFEPVNLDEYSKLKKADTDKKIKLVSGFFESSRLDKYIDEIRGRFVIIPNRVLSMKSFIMPDNMAVTVMCNTFSEDELTELQKGKCLNVIKNYFRYLVDSGRVLYSYEPQVTVGSSFLDEYKISVNVYSIIAESLTSIKKEKTDNLKALDESELDKSILKFMPECPLTVVVSPSKIVSALPAVGESLKLFDQYLPVNIKQNDLEKIEQYIKKAYIGLHDDNEPVNNEGNLFKNIILVFVTSKHFNLEEVIKNLESEKNIRKLSEEEINGAHVFVLNGPLFEYIGFEDKLHLTQFSEQIIALGSRKYIEECIDSFNKNKKNNPAFSEVLSNLGNPDDAGIRYRLETKKADSQHFYKPVVSTDINYKERAGYGICCNNTITLYNLYKSNSTGENVLSVLSNNEYNKYLATLFERKVFTAEVTDITALTNTNIIKINVKTFLNLIIKKIEREVKEKNRKEDLLTTENEISGSVDSSAGEVKKYEKIEKLGIQEDVLGRKYSVSELIKKVDKNLGNNLFLHLPESLFYKAFVCDYKPKKYFIISFYYKNPGKYKFTLIDKDRESTKGVNGQFYWQLSNGELVDRQSSENIKNSETKYLKLQLRILSPIDCSLDELKIDDNIYNIAGNKCFKLSYGTNTLLPDELYINAENFKPVLFRTRLKKGPDEIINIIYKNYVKLNNFTVPEDIIVFTPNPTEEGQVTIFKIKDLNVDSSVPDKIFYPENQNN